MSILKLNLIALAGATLILSSASGAVKAETPVTAPLGTPNEELSGDALQKLVTDQPANPDNHFKLGRFYEKNGFLSLARDEYRKVIDLTKDNPKAFIGLALIDLRTSQRKEGQDLIDDALTRFPKNYDVLLAAGYFYQNKPDIDRAIGFFKRAEALDPSKPDAHACLADAYGHQHKFDTALDEANKALSIDKNMDLANYEKAASLISLKKYVEALEPLKKNFQKNPLDYKNTQLYLEDLMHLRRSADAFEVLLCRLSNQDKEGMANFKQGARSFMSTFPQSVVDEGIKKADQDLSKSPMFAANIHFALGDVYDGLNKPDKAMEQYRQGIKLNPNYGRAYLRLGFDQDSKFNNVIDAMDNYAKAYKLDPRDSQIELAYHKTLYRINNNLWLKFCYWVHGLFAH